MEFIGILFSLFFAVIITAIFNLAFKSTGPWGGFWVFFILTFFISLGAGEWAAHRGPSAYGYYWVPGLVAAIVFALVLAAASPRTSPLRKKNDKSHLSPEERISEEEISVAAAVLGIFFWILIVTLILIAIAGLVSKM